MCLLNRAKIIRSTTALFQKKVKELGSMFQENGYPKSCFDKMFKRFLTEQDAKEKTIPDTFEKENYYITIPYLESESRHFINKLAKIMKNNINVNIVPVYKSFKLGRYFQLKSNTASALSSNVVYKFTCSCDMNLTYYGMSTRHLITRVRKRLDFSFLLSKHFRPNIKYHKIFNKQNIKLSYSCVPNMESIIAQHYKQVLNRLSSADIEHHPEIAAISEIAR